MNLNKIFLKYCKNDKFEINNNQLDVIENLKDYHQKFYLVKQLLILKKLKKETFFLRLKEKKMMVINS